MMLSGLLVTRWGNLYVRKNREEFAIAVGNRIGIPEAFVRHRLVLWWRYFLPLLVGVMILSMGCDMM